MKNIPTIVPVVALALVARDGRILLQRRPDHRQHGGLWEFPGGKVEPGESCKTALVREIAEELGISVRPEDLEELAFAADEKGSDAGAPPVVILLYTCRRWQGEPQSLDSQTLAWVKPEQLGQLEMPPLDIPLAKRLIGASK